MTQRERIEESFAFIVDSLSTASIPFHNTLLLLRDMGQQADEGDEAAHKVLDIVYRFERLLRTDPEKIRKRS